MMISLLVLIPFDQTDKTFIRPLWCKKSSPYCGENLGGVKRHLWNAGGGGGARLRSRSGGISTGPPDCPHLDWKLSRKCARILDPGLLCLICPRCSDYLSGGRLPAAFCLDRYLKCPDFSIVNLYSVREKLMRSTLLLSKRRRRKENLSEKGLWRFRVVQSMIESVGTYSINL